MSPRSRLAGFTAPAPVAAAVALALLLPALLAGPACAHGVGTSQLELVLDGRRLEGAWTLSLRDARMALGLDPFREPVDSAFVELRAREPALRALLLRSIEVRADSLPCRCALADSPMTWNRRFDDIGFRLVADCPVAPTHLFLKDELLFDLDPGHRGYFSVQDARAYNVGVFRVHERSASFDVRQFHAGAIVLEFIREGVHHIASGIDHLLFLLALLLPSVLVRTRRDWSPRPRPGEALREVLKVVTAFTVAHSITLFLGFFGMIRLPEAWIETGIAASVFAASWNNLRPFLPGKAWVMAFAFGLVHGLGFAGALANLQLPQRARGLALAAFNIGVELGQVVIVLAVLPLLYFASRRAWYPKVVMGLGSLAIAWLAVIWVLERGFGLALFSR